MFRLLFREIDLNSSKATLSIRKIIAFKKSDFENFRHHTKYQNMKESEEALKGGRSTETVVRIGNTVRRSVGNNANLVHALLQHLEKVQFPYAPRFLGIDNKGREILTYFKGEVLRGVSFNMDQLIACVKMLRAFHDAASLSDLCGQEETICHYDFAPWNIISQEGLPIGIIDFDDCRIGARVEDLAYFIWTFLELGDSVITDTEQLEKIAVLCKAYNLDPNQNLAVAILKQQERILHFRQEKAKNEKDTTRRIFSANAVITIQKSIKWVKANYDDIKF